MVKTKMPGVYPAFSIEHIQGAIIYGVYAGQFIITSCLTSSLNKSTVLFTALKA